MKTDESIYVRHILDAINRIEEYTFRVEYEDFLTKDIIQAAVIREFEIIGEESKKLTKATREKYPGVPWNKMAGMRDKLIHDYMGVDIDAV
jgi:uncharacterized protein with HEPN domain